MWQRRPRHGSSGARAVHRSLPLERLRLEIGEHQADEQLLVLLLLQARLVAGEHLAQQEAANDTEQLR